MKLWILFWVTAVLANDFTIEEKRGTLDEAEQAIHRKAYSEGMSHLQTVVAAQRTRRWEKLVEKAACGQLKEVSEAQDTGVEVLADNLLNTFPWLRRSKAFIADRRKYGLRSLEACYRNGFIKGECLGRATAFYTKVSEDKALFNELVRLVVAQEGQGPALSLYERAIDESLGICRDKGMHEAVHATLSQPDGEDARAARRIAGEKCPKQLMPFLTKNLDKDSSELRKKATCEVYRAFAQKTPACLKIKGK